MNRRIVIGSMLTLAGALPALAQSPRMRQLAPPTEVSTAVVPATPGDAQVPVETRLRVAAVESKVTTGRPYSAEATTEFVQVLGDGNKIVRKTTVRIARDSEGRTRREELAPDGTIKAISIYDPVDHVSFVLDPATRTAQKSAVRIVYPASAAVKVEAEREAAARVAGKVVVSPLEVPSAAAAEDMRKRQGEVVARTGGAGFGAVARTPGDAKRESLGQKIIDGVQAEGTRTTTVIPAGAIGNQQEITVVSEQWFSPDLEILLMTKHSDPRTGETSYTLSGIVRAEPAAGTFDVPGDYTIRESTYMRQPALR